MTDNDLNNEAKSLVTALAQKHGTSALFAVLGVVTGIIRMTFGYEQMREYVNVCMEEVKRREMN